MLLTVASVQAQTATTISVETPSPIIAGWDAYVTVTLDADINAIATLTVTDGASYNKTFNVGLVGGNGFFVVPNPAEGTYSITASFAGNEQYSGSTSEVQTVEINKVTTALMLSLKDEAIYVGDFTNFIVELQNPDDHKQISTNGVVTVRLTDKDTFNDATDKVYIVGLANGKNSETGYKDSKNMLTDLPAGTYKLKAFYAGNGVYTGCESNVVTLTVSKIATTLTVADITPINAGEDAIVALTATPTDYTGYATVTVGSNSYKVAIVNGTGSCIIPNLTAGTYNVTAQIAQDDKYLGSTDTKQVTVSEGTDPAIERNAVATVSVTPTDYTGNVTVTIDGNNYNVAIIDGTGTLVLPQLAAGTYAISASIAEDGKYAASSNEEAQIVSVTGVTFPFATGQTWATWCDDYAWLKPEGVTAYTISAVSGNTVTIAEVEGDNIPSHTPLLLKKTADAVTPTKVITGTGTDALVSTTPTGATFYGNASDTKITTGYNYAIGQSYGLYNGEFVLIDTDNGIPANRCLLNVGSTNGAPKLSISTDVVGVKEVIEVNASLEVKDDSWYTLDGRKLEGMPTTKGIYINKGIKVVVK